MAKVTATGQYTMNSQDLYKKIHQRRDISVLDIKIKISLPEDLEHTWDTQGKESKARATSEWIATTIRTE